MKMDVINKFDGSVLGEVDDSTIDINKNTKETLLEPMEIVNVMLEELSSMLNDDTMMRVYSSETGKCLSSCRREIELSKLYLLYRAYPKVYGSYGNGRVITSGFSRKRYSFIHQGIPVFSLTRELVESILETSWIHIEHCKDSPIATMKITEKLAERVHGFENILSETVCDYFQGINIKDAPEGGTVSIWGKERKLSETLDSMDIKYTGATNYASIVRGQSQVDKAINSVMKLSFASVSNLGLSSQVYLVSDKEFLYFKNRVSELLKRTATGSYSPDSNINYYPGKRTIDNTKTAVKELLNNGWDFVDNIPDTVHVLTLQYGETPEKIREINGPLIEIIHYTSLKECADIVQKMNFPEIINIYTDSINDTEYLKQRFGNAIKISVNGTDERDIGNVSLLSSSSNS